jgi:hypothetical protein
MRDKVPRHKKANMWCLFLMWCAIIASVPVHHNGLEAFALPSTIKRLPDIFWTTSNPMHDLSLPIFLDTEIWKASCYIHQTTPPKQQRTNEQIADGWETFGIALKEE